MGANITRTSIQVAQNLPFEAGEIADYLLQPDILHHWIDAEAELRPALDSNVSFPPASVMLGAQPRTDGERLDGKVTSLAWPAINKSAPAVTAEKRFELIAALGPSNAPAAHVALRISSRPDGTSRFRISHDGLTSNQSLRACLKFWQRALARVGSLMARIERSRLVERQAIIVVHGIGEQAPGQLLREFVANVLDRDKGEVYIVKPDYVSPLFDMRMATAPRIDATRPTTDIYELYWAHLIRDTTVAQVYSWMLHLVLSPDAKIPKSLLRAVWVLRVALVLGALAVVWLMSIDVAGWLKGLGIASLAALPAVAKFAFTSLQSKFVVNFAGDAARYLEPRAGNIARRQEIREAGANLLDALHDAKLGQGKDQGGSEVQVDPNAKDRYARIIVYGHSLGSVIAYDILTHAWTKSGRKRKSRSQTTQSRAIRALENLLNTRPGHDTTATGDEVQAMQHAAWEEYRRNGFNWRITDFVTAGSPLSHGRWLLNVDAKTQFADLVHERSFPTCPPQTKSVASPHPGTRRNAFTFTHAYGEVTHRNRKRQLSVQIPDHGGLFALTRWTNLYFPYHGLFSGDPVAGPLVEQFGAWIKDVRLRETKGFAHCRYTDRTLEPEAVAKLRAALNLPLRRPLNAYTPTDLLPTEAR